MVQPHVLDVGESLVVRWLAMKNLVPRGLMFVVFVT